MVGCLPRFTIILPVLSNQWPSKDIGQKTACAHVRAPSFFFFFLRAAWIVHTPCVTKEIINFN